MSGHDAEDATRPVARARAAGDAPTAWFGRLYAEAKAGRAVRPSDQHAASASPLAPGGTLLVGSAAGEGDADGPPWPLTRAEIDGFAVDGVALRSVELLRSDPARRRIEFVGENPA